MGNGWTIPASANLPEPTRLDFPLPLIVRTLPQAANAAARRPDGSDRVAYGRYLTSIAGCTHCHTPMDEKLQPLPGRSLKCLAVLLAAWAQC